MTQPSVVVDWDQVRQLGAAIAKLPLASSFKEQVSRPVDADDEAAFRGFLWAASICHSTHGGLKGQRGVVEFGGWDYLLEAFSWWAERDPAEIAPARLRDLHAEGLTEMLRAPFTEAVIGLADLDRRAAMLSELSSALETEYAGSVVDLLARCENRVGGCGGAYERLAVLPAFDDALAKKASAFLMAVHFSGRWPVGDPEAVQPMIDYHRMRLLLRTGCIRPVSAELGESLRRRVPASATSAAQIRTAAMDICMAMPAIASMSVFDFDVLLWALARSVCRHRPICISKEAENFSFFDYTGLPIDGPCVLEGICPGARLAEYRDLWEPQLETEDY